MKKGVIFWERLHLLLIIGLVLGISSLYLVTAFNFDVEQEGQTVNVNLYDDVMNLTNLEDVNATNPSDEEVLTWDAASSRWIPQSAQAVGDTNETDRVNALYSFNYYNSNIITHQLSD
jgi:hypothetical protein